MKRRVSSLDLKIVVLGTAAVGKTSIINRYCNGSFLEDTLATMGCAFFSHTVQMEQTEISAILWDTAGEERFKAVAPSLLRGAQGLILVFDLTSLESFNDLGVYLNMFLDTAEYDTNVPLPILLLGNKADLNSPAVPQETIDAWMEKNHISQFMKVSAKTGEGIEESIDSFVKGFAEIQPKDDSKSIQIMVTDPKEKHPSGCSC